MSETVLVSRGGSLQRIARSEWEAELAHAPEAGRRRLAFMTPEHHRVRNTLVRELPRHPEGLGAADVSSAPEILDDLERNLFFLVRRPKRVVTWAFPVTVEQTPHRLTFDSGERCFAA